MKKHAHHCLPTGETPVPENEDGKRVCNGCELHCRGWSNGGNVHQSRATKEDPFPASRGGSLDAELLEQLGLTAAGMADDDGGPDSFCCFTFVILL